MECSQHVAEDWPTIIRLAAVVPYISPAKMEVIQSARRRLCGLDAPLVENVMTALFAEHTEGDEDANDIDTLPRTHKPARRVVSIPKRGAGPSSLAFHPASPSSQSAAAQSVAVEQFSLSTLVDGSSQPPTARPVVMPHNRAKNGLRCTVCRTRMSESDHEMSSHHVTAALRCGAALCEQLQRREITADGCKLLVAIQAERKYVRVYCSVCGNNIIATSADLDECVLALHRMCFAPTVTTATVPPQMQNEPSQLQASGNATVATCCVCGMNWKGNQHEMTPQHVAAALLCGAPLCPELHPREITVDGRKLLVATRRERKEHVRVYCSACGGSNTVETSADLDECVFVLHRTCFAPINTNAPPRTQNEPSQPPAQAEEMSQHGNASKLLCCICGVRNCKVGHEMKPHHVAAALRCGAPLAPQLQRREITSDGYELLVAIQTNKSKRVKVFCSVCGGSAFATSAGLDEHVLALHWTCFAPINTTATEPSQPQPSQARTVAQCGMNTETNRHETAPGHAPQAPEVLADGSDGDADRLSPTHQTAWRAVPISEHLWPSLPHTVDGPSQPPASQLPQQNLPRMVDRSTQTPVDRAVVMPSYRTKANGLLCDVCGEDVTKTAKGGHEMLPHHVAAALRSGAPLSKLLQRREIIVNGCKLLVAVQAQKRPRVFCSVCERMTKASTKQLEVDVQAKHRTCFAWPPTIQPHMVDGSSQPPAARAMVMSSDRAKTEARDVRGANTKNMRVHLLALHRTCFAPTIPPAPPQTQNERSQPPPAQAAEIPEHKNAPKANLSQLQPSVQAVRAHAHRAIGAGLKLHHVAAALRCGAPLCRQLQRREVEMDGHKLLVATRRVKQTYLRVYCSVCGGSNTVDETANLDECLLALHGPCFATTVPPQTLEEPSQLQPSQVSNNAIVERCCVCGMNRKENQHEMLPLHVAAALRSGAPLSNELQRHEVTLDGRGLLVAHTTMGKRGGVTVVCSVCELSSHETDIESMGDLYDYVRKRHRACFLLPSGAPVPLSDEIDVDDCHVQ